MGAYLSRKYHYILRTAKAQTLPHEKRMEAAHALNDLGIDTEADLPEWVQKLIKGHVQRSRSCIEQGTESENPFSGGSQDSQITRLRAAGGGTSYWTVGGCD